MNLEPELGKMKRFCWIGLCVVVSGLGAAAQPNFIVIMADDLGAECIGAYGAKDYATPHLDRLAGEGTLFEHCHAQPLCTPSRVKIMTGLRNDRNYDVFGVLPKGEKTFAHMLKDAGYDTAVVGKWQLLGRDEKTEGKGQTPDEAGFDEWLLWQVDERGERYAEPELVEKGGTTTVRSGKYGPEEFSDWIDDYLVRDRERPFFLYFPMAMVHNPFTPTPDSEEWQEEDRRNEDRKQYFAGMIAYMDQDDRAYGVSFGKAGHRRKHVAHLYWRQWDEHEYCFGHA